MNKSKKVSILIVILLLIFPNHIFGVNFNKVSISYSNQRKSEMVNGNDNQEYNRLKIAEINEYDSQGRRTYIEGEFIIKYKDNIEYSTKSHVFDNYNLQIKESIPKMGIQLVSMPKNIDVVEFTNRLSKDRSIEYIEPNYLYYPSNITNDPLSSELWGLKNVGQTIMGNKGVPGMDIDVLEAWKHTMGSSNVIVAVIDEGTDINHPDLKNNIWRNPNEILNGRDSDGNGYIDDIHGWDFFNNDNSVFDPEDGDYHGTHVSGTIAAENNDIGIVGVAPNVKIMPLKFLGPDGGNSMDAILAIEYAKSKGAKIINASWGGGGYSQALKDAIENSGALFAAAAGNSDYNNDFVPSYPANYDCYNIISVAAMDVRGEKAGFSNYGRSSVHIAAPGVDILSTVPKG